MEYFPNPDSGVTLTAVTDYGYTWSGMIPLSPEKASWFWDNMNLPIYRLNSNGSESMVDNSADLKGSPYYGIEKDVWETYCINQRFETAGYDGKYTIWDGYEKQYLTKPNSNDILVFPDKETAQSEIEKMKLEAKSELENVATQSVTTQAPGSISKQDLENTIKDITHNFHTKPEDMAEFLKFSSRFYNYSARNTMLIYKQNKGALFCGSFKRFKDMGYSVLKGQHGMKVLVPTQKTYLEIGGKLVPLSVATKSQKAAYKRGEIKAQKKLLFKVGTVFDIAQTNIPKSDYPKYLGIGVSSDRHKELYDLLVSYNRDKLNVPVKENQLQSVALRGYYAPNENSITISGSFDDTARLSILSHETGHAQLHNTTEALKRPTPQIEFEADCFSIMFSTYAGVEVAETRCRHLSDSYSEMTKIKDFKPEMLQQSLNRAQQAFKSVVDYVNPILYPEMIMNGTTSEQAQAPSSAPTAEAPTPAEPVLPNQIPDMGGFGMAFV